MLRAAIDYYRAAFRKSERPLGRLGAPMQARALLVAGGKDFGGHLGPYKKTQTMFGGGAELLVIPEAGHWPHLEDQARFGETLVQFLGEAQQKK